MTKFVPNLENSVMLTNQNIIMIDSKTRPV